MSEQSTALTGLYTNVASGQVPPGSLRRATNVVLRSPGTIGPRPGFLRYTIGSISSTNMRRLIPYRDSILVIGEGASNTWRCDWFPSGTGLTLPTGSSTLDTIWIRGASHRGNLYITTEGWIVRILNPDATTSSAVYNLSNIRVVALYSAGTILATLTQCAVRVLIKKSHTSTFFTFGPPTPRLVVRNTTAGNQGIELRIVAQSGQLAVGDTLQVYRSIAVPTTSTVPDQLFLAYERTITSQDITDADPSNTGFAIFLTRSDAELGAELYVNPNQEGAGKSNYHPPNAKDVALFKGSLWFANTREPHSLTITHPSLTSANGQTYATRTGQATGLGRRSYTGNLTLGNNQITSASSTTGLEVGMLVDHSNFADGTRITAISGSTITCSTNSLGNSTGTTLGFDDAVWIKDGTGTEYHQQTGTSFSAHASLVDFSTKVRAERVTDGQTTILTSGSTTQTDDGAITTAVVLRRPLIGDSSFEVFATHGTEYSPQIPLPTAATGKISVQESYPNRLYWSKTNEPEHVPLDNWVAIGDESQPIIRIVPTTETLLVFKRDGLYRVDGYGADVPDPWSVTPLDSTLRLLAPEAAVALGDVVFAWTNRGVVRVTGSSLDFISLPINDRLDKVQRALDGISLSTYSSTNDSVAAWATANPRDSEFLLSVPTTSPGTNSGTIYVWNDLTRAWSDWSLSRNHGCHNLGKIHLADPDTTGYRVHQEFWFATGTTGPFDAFSDTNTATINSITGNAITIASHASWTPAVGDVVTIGAALSWITAVTSSTVFTLADASGFTTGTAQVYQAFESTVQLQAHASGVPTVAKHFSTVSWHFDTLTAIDRIVFGFGSENSTTDTEYTHGTTYSSSLRPAVLRSFVPRSHARSHLLYPYIKVRRAISNWSLSGISTVALPESTRGTRRTG